jgi:hypothetical protein
MQIEIYACGKCKSISLYKDVDVGGPVYIACRICGNRWPGAGAKPVKVTKDDMGTVTGVFVDGEPFDTGINADDDNEGGISELEEVFSDTVKKSRGGLRVGAGRPKNTPVKKAQGSATREKNLAARKELVAVALREGDGMVEIRAKCHVGKATVYEVLDELQNNNEALKCRCGREIMHKGGCKGAIARMPLPANQVSSSYSKPADVVPTVILQQKPTVDKIIPSEKKEISPGTITALKAEIRSRYEAKIAGLKTKMDMVLAALDELAK